MSPSLAERMERACHDDLDPDELSTLARQLRVQLPDLERAQAERIHAALGQLLRRARAQQEERRGQLAEVGRGRRAQRGFAQALRTSRHSQRVSRKV